MMKTLKILININNIKELEEYKKIGIVNFLFAVKDYSVGYQAFNLSEIPDDAYLLMNRLFDTEAIDSLKGIIPELKRFRGIVFEDIGLYNVLKTENIDLIWFQNHFGTNTNSINFWLDKVSSAIISNEITKEEIKDIVANVNKPIVLNVLGKNQIMYSRRTLLTNFNKHFNLDNKNDVVIKNGNNEFFVRENMYGTTIFNNEYFNYLNFIPELNDDNILYYLLFNLDLSVQEIKSILDGKAFGNDGFLNKKTVYKMAEYNDR